MTTSDILAKILSLSIRRRLQFCSHIFGINLRLLRPIIHDSLYVQRYFMLFWSRKCDFRLEPPPDSSVEQFGVICRGDGKDITRKLIELHKKERHDPLDLSCFVGVTALFAYRIEFVEEKNTRARAHIIKQVAKPRVCFPKITPYQGVISDDKQRQR